MKLFLLVAFMMLPMSVFAQDISKFFPGLQEINIKTRCDVKVLYNPKVAKVIDRKFHDTEPEPEPDRWEVLLNQALCAGRRVSYRVQ